MHTAILLAAYGSRHPRFRGSFARIEERVRDRYPEAMLAWSVTSKHVRGLDKDTDSPAEALARLARAGATHVVAQSLHIISGSEYEELLDAVEQKRGLFARIAAGAPLLSSPADIANAARSLLDAAPTRDDRSGAALVFVAHGTAHAGAAAYAELAAELARRAPGSLLGLLEAGRHGPGPEGVRDALLAAGIRRAVLMPIFFTAGMHVEKDVAGAGPGSYSSVLGAAGIETKAVLRGAAEDAGLVAIWLAHLDEAVRRVSV